MEHPPLQVLFASFLLFALSTFLLFNKHRMFWLKMLVTIFGIGTASFFGLFYGLVCYMRNEPGSANYYTGKTFYYLTRPILRIRFNIEGNQDLLDVMKHGPAVVICNHQSSMDILSMAAFWRTRMAVVAKEEMKWYPFLGQFMTLAQNVFIRRKDRAKAIGALGAAAQEIKKRNVSFNIDQLTFKCIVPNFYIYNARMNMNMNNSTVGQRFTLS